MGLTSAWDEALPEEGCPFLLKIWGEPPLSLRVPGSVLLRHPVLCPHKNGSKRREWVTIAFSSQPVPPPQGLLPTQGYKVCHNRQSGFLTGPRRKDKLAS